MTDSLTGPLTDSPKYKEMLSHLKKKEIIIGSVEMWEGGLSRVTGSKKRNPSSWTVQVQSSNVQVQPMSKSIAALQKSTVIECPKSYRNRSNGMVK